MNMTKTKMFVTGAALLVGVAVPVYLQVSLNRAEARHLTAMAEMGDALSSLQAEHDDLVVAEQKLRARLEQQKADRSELFKLRGTVNQLRSDKKRLENSLANSSGPESEDRAVEAGPVSTYSGFFNSEIGPDESVIAGGWRIGPGRRGFLVVHAEVDQSLGANTVVIKNGLLEATDEVARALELGPVPSDPSVETASKILNSEALDEYLKSEQEDGGLQFLGAPMVTTLGGRQATISTAEEIEIDGEPYQTGVTLVILPEIRTDGSGVGVTVMSEWAVPRSEEF